MKFETLLYKVDGPMRNTPEAARFIDVAAKRGVGAAVQERDGAFGD